MTESIPTDSKDGTQSIRASCPAPSPAPILPKVADGRAVPIDERDGRHVGGYKSIYPPEIQKQIWLETGGVVLISLGSLLAIFLLWAGVFDSQFCSSCSRPAFKRYGYFFLGGIFGGTLFGIKYLYHVVAKGYWHQDRRLWRVLSPLLSGSLAFIVGVLTQAGLMGVRVGGGASTYIGLGFITGYFGDKALAKMTEIADVIFGTSNARHKKNGD
ncbi:hypothetical protein [Schauerella aestuarii]|uniref:hypothetical protein n=1 Tax=Schauerella aestuarii TaxID=2511204 RepID=UPI0013710BAA|nr:hypothetical protein [Achromobacter aestuarii]MYZ45188.1 hypothetical protein [Achromobacter aestuarii]